MSEERIDATDEQFAQAFDDLRHRLHMLPQDLEYLVGKFQEAVDSRIRSNQAKAAAGEKPDTNIEFAEWLELASYRDELCEDLRAAMRWALEFDTELPSCARLANALQSVAGSGPDYKQFVFDAQVELDRVRAMFERAAEKSKPAVHWKQRLLALHDAAKKRDPNVTYAEIISAFAATEADRKAILSEQRGKPKPIEATMKQAIRRHRREQQP